METSSFWLAIAFGMVVLTFIVFRKKFLGFLDRYVSKVRQAIADSIRSHEEQISLYSEMEERLEKADTVINNMLINAREKLEHLEKKRADEHNTLRKSQEELLNNRRDLLRRETMDRLRAQVILEAVETLKESFSEKPASFGKYLEPLGKLKL